MTVIQASLPALSQNVIRGKVINTNGGGPLAGASVFISNSSIGVVSDREGNFELTGIPVGQHELIISSIGYETNVYAFNSSQLPLKLRIEMSIKIRELENVTVEPSVEEGWDRWGKTFMDNFVGTTPAAAKCKIKNGKAIRFRYFRKSNRVIAYCDEPIILENKELGYIVRFQLEDFEVKFKEATSRYTGYPFFEEMNDKRKKLPARLQKARDKAYYGSMMHFMRSLWQDSLSQNGFEVRRMVRTTNHEKERVKKIVMSSNFIMGAGGGNPGKVTLSLGGNKNSTPVAAPEIAGSDSSEYYKYVLRQDDYIDTYGRDLLNADSLFLRKENDYKVLYFPNYLYVTYKYELEDKAYLELYREKRQPTFQRSHFWFIAEEAMAVYPNGSYFPPQLIMSMSYWGWSEKMANFLPVNYKPFAPVQK